MDMGSILATVLVTILNCKRDLYVHCSGSLKNANIDSSSYKVAKTAPVVFFLLPLKGSRGGNLRTNLGDYVRIHSSAPFLALY